MAQRVNSGQSEQSRAHKRLVALTLSWYPPGVAAIQTLLFRDPSPLLEALGQEFFGSIPQCPGVYLMRDAGQTVLYVGKAKNLRKRLGSYRVANPDRMPRRHLRLLRAVARIDLEQCPDEGSALARESELLLKLRPRFNRAGTWPAQVLYLLWRNTEEHFELTISGTPERGWAAFGPMGSIVRPLRNALARLIWCAIHPGLGPSRMPLGWMHGQFDTITSIRIPNMVIDPSAWLQKLGGCEPEELVEWLRANVPRQHHLFDQTAIDADLEFLGDFLSLGAAKKASVTSGI